MVEALKTVLQEGKPSFIRTDRGSEFAGSADKYMKSQDVKHITTSEHSKANYAERVIRTIKGKLGQYMAYNKMRRWIDALPDITESYNNTYHRTIKMSPKEAFSTPDPILWTTQKKKKTTKPIKIKKRLHEKNSCINLNPETWSACREYPDAMTRKVTGNGPMNCLE